jgi:hypothetical protein
LLEVIGNSWHASFSAPGAGVDAAAGNNRGVGGSALAAKKNAVLSALILICSAAVTPDLGECTRKNAAAEMRVPAEFGNPITCLMHRQH